MNWKYDQNEDSINTEQLSKEIQKEKRNNKIQFIVFVIFPITLLVLSVSFSLPGEYQGMVNIVSVMMMMLSLLLIIPHAKFAGWAFVIGGRQIPIFPQEKEVSLPTEPEKMDEADEDKTFEEMVQQINQKKKKKIAISAIFIAFIVLVICDSLIGPYGMIGIAYRTLFSFIMTAGTIFLLYYLIRKVTSISGIKKGFCTVTLILVITTFINELFRYGLLLYLLLSYRIS